MKERRRRNGDTDERTVQYVSELMEELSLCLKDPKFAATLQNAHTKEDPKPYVSTPRALHIGPFVITRINPERN